MAKFPPVYDLKYHLVFCTKRKSPVLVGDIVAVCDKLIRESAAALECKIESLQVSPDHVVIFISANPFISVREIVKKIKAKVGDTLRANYPQLRRASCFWSSSYYVGTAGAISESVIKMFVESQRKQ